MKFKTFLASGVALAFLGATVCVHAQITVDGTLDAGYGSALAVQTFDQEFGRLLGAKVTTIRDLQQRTLSRCAVCQWSQSNPETG